MIARVVPRRSAPGAIIAWLIGEYYVSVNLGFGLGPFVYRECDGAWLYGLGLGVVGIVVHAKWY